MGKKEDLKSSDSALFYGNRLIGGAWLLDAVLWASAAGFYVVGFKDLVAIPIGAGGGLGITLILKRLFDPGGNKTEVGFRLTRDS